MYTATYSLSCALFPCSLESVPASLQACPAVESNMNSGWALPKQQMITGIWKESGINNSSFLTVPLNFLTSNITSWLAEFWIKEEVVFHLGKSQASMTRYISKERVKRRGQFQYQNMSAIIQEATRQGTVNTI